MNQHIRITLMQRFEQARGQGARKLPRACPPRVKPPPLQLRLQRNNPVIDLLKRCLPWRCHNGRDFHVAVLLLSCWHRFLCVGRGGRGEMVAGREGKEGL